jgi:hypothetical protein
MSLTLKLLGPDVPQDFSLTVDSSLTVTQVKEKARSEWPDGTRAPLSPPPASPSSRATATASLSAATADERFCLSWQPTQYRPAPFG